MNLSKILTTTVILCSISSPTYSEEEYIPLQYGPSPRHQAELSGQLQLGYGTKQAVEKAEKKARTGIAVGTALGGLEGAGKGLYEGFRDNRQAFFDFGKLFLGIDPSKQRKPYEPKQDKKPETKSSTIPSTAREF